MTSSWQRSTAATQATQATQATLAKTGNGRKNVVYSVEQSLKRLMTDRIDLLWVHHADNVTPIEEILRGLDDLVRASNVLYIGFSNFPAWRMLRADLMADLRTRRFVDTRGCGH